MCFSLVGLFFMFWNITKDSSAKSNIYCGYFGVINTGLCVLLGQKSLSFKMASSLECILKFQLVSCKWEALSMRDCQGGWDGSLPGFPDDGNVGSPWIPYGSGPYWGSAHGLAPLAHQEICDRTMAGRSFQEYLGNCSRVPPAWRGLS